jgi:hypothetical protein
MLVQKEEGVDIANLYALTVVVNAKFQMLDKKPNPSLPLQSDYSLQDPEDVLVVGKYSPVANVSFYKITFYDTATKSYLTNQVYNLAYNANSTPTPIPNINCCQWQLNIENALTESAVLPTQLQFSNLQNISATKYVPNATLAARRWSANISTNATTSSALLTINGYGLFSPQVLPNPPAQTVFVVLYNKTRTEAVVTVKNTAVPTLPTVFDPYGEDIFTIPTFALRQYVATPSSVFTVTFAGTDSALYSYTFSPSSTLNEPALLPTNGNTVGSATGSLVPLNPDWTSYFLYQNDFSFQDNGSDVDPSPFIWPEPSPPPTPVPPPKPKPSPGPSPSPKPTPPSPSPEPTPPSPSPEPTPPSPSPEPTPPSPSPSTKSTNTTTIIVVVVVAAVVIIAAILTGWYVHKHKAAKSAAKT